MSEKQTLRIGVCGCAASFHGKFAGLTVSVGQLKDGMLEEPFSFELVEVLIPEKGDRRDALKRSRVHFFFDAHPDPEGISISFVELVPKSFPNRRGLEEHLYIRGLRWVRDEKWPANHPLGEEEVSRAIGRMLSTLDRAKFERWFSVMNAQR